MTGWGLEDFMLYQKGNLGFSWIQTGSWKLWYDAMRSMVILLIWHHINKIAGSAFYQNQEFKKLSSQSDLKKFVHAGRSYRLQYCKAQCTRTIHEAWVHGWRKFTGVRRQYIADLLSVYNSNGPLRSSCANNLTAPRIGSKCAEGALITVVLFFGSSYPLTLDQSHLCVHSKTDSQSF